MTDELDLLITRYLDGRASDDEVDRLDALIVQDPNVAGEVFLHALQDVAVRDWVAARRPRRSPRAWRWAVGLAAAAALLAVAGLFMPPRPPAAVVRIEKLQGDVRVVKAGVRSTAAAGQVLAPGQGIETGGGFVILRLGELSLEVGRETSVASVGPEIELSAGSLRVEGRSACAVVTPAARAELVAPKAEVRAAPDSTWIDVHGGQARFARRADGVAIDLTSDQCAQAKAGQALRAMSQREAVDPLGLEWAVERGIRFLGDANPQGDARTVSRELVLLASVVAGVPDKKLLDEVLRTPLERTYNVALQAVLLEKLDRRAYLARIAQCAQFLVDNQCKNGQWSYGDPAGPPELPVAESPLPGIQGPRRAPVAKKRKDGGRSGDNSNSQYACWGLLACHDAGVVLPREVVEKARDWWLESRAPAEGVGRGWGYRKEVDPLAPKDGKDGVTGTMTAGALSALAICERLLGAEAPRREVEEGLAWLASRFTVSDNPGGTRRWQYYYLAGLERAGSLLGVDRLGSRRWHVEGARYLMAEQNLDGSWTRRPDRVWDTCFAILFLKRATRPLSETPTLEENPK